MQFCLSNSLFFSKLDQEVNDPDSSLIAYYCRSYAVDKGIKLRIDDPAVNTFLFSLMDTLESSKKSLPTNDSGAAAVTCENYAYNIFSKADDEYRSGESTKDTARQFYAASTFYDILEQFGPLDEEVLEKRKYSKWKAADIMKAVSSGQRPVLPEMQVVSINCRLIMWCPDAKTEALIADIALAT